MTELLKLSALEAPLDGTTLIEASAGTGKTHTIATLFVRLLLEKGLTVAEILVVTYTKAATAELRQRIRQRLGQALEVFDHALGSAGAHAASDVEPTLLELAKRSIARGRPRADRERLVTALHAFDEASIFTIHGFCQRVLTQSAFETSTGFDTELLEDQRLLVDEVVHDFWARSLYDADEPFTRHVLDSGATPEELSRLAQRVAADLELQILPDLDEAACEEALRERALHPDRALVALKARFVRYVRSELPRRKRERAQQGFDDLLVRLRAAIDGPRGEELLEQIRTRHPAALIDEFQDTDPVQCRVFERIYDPQAVAPLALFLIGDPKQAIYGFRGADVFAYMRAARHAATRAFTLSVNHRSDPQLVRAVNALFSRAQAPFYYPEIRFQPVAAAPSARDALAGSLAGTPALEFLFLQRDPTQVPKKGKTKNKLLKGELGEKLPRLVAAEIVRLLKSGARLGDASVEPRHIAVLCRTNAQAREVQNALRLRAVPAVLEGDDSVFDSSMAEELHRLLSALCEPSAAARVRAALLTSIFGQNADDLLALDSDEAEWDRWLSSFHRWHELWETRGVIQALYAVLADCEVPRRLLALPDGERRLTDLAHLMELLHTQALYTRQGSFALASWYERMREDSRLRVGMASQSAQIRLESDAHAVTLTTIHKSKGLDYPIVYCPFLWDGKLLRGDKYLDFHDLDHDNRRSLDHVKDNPAWDRHKQWAETEALAEHLRLVYVALTRAKHRVSVVWGGINESHSSALAYLLHQPPGAPALGLAAATAARTDGLSDAAMISDLAALAEAAEGCIGVRLLEGGEDPGSYEHREGDIELHEPVLPKLARDIVRASSFSRLATKTKQPLASSVDDAHDLDAADEGLPAPTGEGGDAAAAPELAAQGPRIALAEFPTGAVRGQAIHTIYENIDFRETDPAALLPHVEGALASYGMDTRAAPELGNALAATLLTPIDAEGLPNLACLAPEHRLAELEFVFPVAYAGERAARDAPLRPSTLARVLAAHATSDAEREYADKVAKLEFSSLHGYLRGFIDLVARHDGRYYVLDYKSNHLGKHAGDYAHAPMQAAMFEHHYVLQYLFYVVAVHRHLAQRLPDYDYDRHFGAVYYLFVRGMAPNHAPGSGVYRARPSRALIDDLSRALQSPGGAT